jgi:hypothetical protein
MRPGNGERNEGLRLVATTRGLSVEQGRGYLKIERTRAEPHSLHI